MAAKGSFNIFSSNYVEPDKQMAANLFTTVNQAN